MFIETETKGIYVYLNILPNCKIENFLFSSILLTEKMKAVVLHVQNFFFQCKEGACTLSAMTSGIRRNWIQAIMKNARPTIAPDVTR